MSMGDFGDLFGLGQPRDKFAASDLGRAAAAARRDAAKPAPDNPDAQLPQIRGKQIDGTLYVRAEDVANALERSSATSARKLIARLRRGIR